MGGGAKGPASDTWQGATRGKDRRRLVLVATPTNQRLFCLTKEWLAQMQPSTHPAHTQHTLSTHPAHTQHTLSTHPAHTQHTPSTNDEVGLHEKCRRPLRSGVGGIIRSIWSIFAIPP
jgi:hypothetical protein